MSSKFSNINFKKGIKQIPVAIQVLASTPGFIKKHKLWKGFWEHTWVLMFSLGIAVSFTYVLYNNVHNYFTDPTETIDIEIPEEGIDAAIKNLTFAASQVTGKEKENLESKIEDLVEVKEEFNEHKSFFSGSLKFLLLIFLEILIFHFAVKTNNILKDQSITPKFQSFYKAQIRMIKVMFRKWVYGLLMYIFISILCGITSTEILKETFMLFIYGYYLGFAFLDNYLEQFHFTIKESSKNIQSHFGAALVIGLFASLLMHIPIFGPLFVPLICGIAATRYGHLCVMESFLKQKMYSTQL